MWIFKILSGIPCHIIIFYNFNFYYYIFNGLFFINLSNYLITSQPHKIIFKIKVWWRGIVHGILEQSKLITDFNPKPDLNSKSDFHSKSDFNPISDFNSKADFIQKSDFNSKSDFNPLSDFNPQSDFNSKSDFNPKVDFNPQFLNWRRTFKSFGVLSVFRPSLWALYCLH